MGREEHAQGIDSRGNRIVVRSGEEAAPVGKVGEMDDVPVDEIPPSLVVSSARQRASRKHEVEYVVGDHDSRAGGLRMKILDSRLAHHLKVKGIAEQHVVADLRVADRRVLGA